MRHVAQFHSDSASVECGRLGHRFVLAHVKVLDYRCFIFRRHDVTVVACQVRTARHRPELGDLQQRSSQDDQLQHPRRKRRKFRTVGAERKAHEYKTSTIERHAFFHTHMTRPTTFSVNGKEMRYNDAFAAHVAQKVTRC